jgi:8-oxo-dGTP pyrophosphatase MutT (NUDIX family)
MTQQPIAQAGALPFRDLASKPEILLVTSTNTGRWVFPKGGIDPGNDALDTALEELYEEAGYLGTIDGDALGHYNYEKRGRLYQVALYPVLVSGPAPDWPERNIRERRWWPPRRAFERLEDPALQNFLRQFLDSRQVSL